MFYNILNFEANHVIISPLGTIQKVRQVGDEGGDSQKVTKSDTGKRGCRK